MIGRKCFFALSVGHLGSAHLLLLRRLYWTVALRAPKTVVNVSISTTLLVLSSSIWDGKIFLKISHLSSKLCLASNSPTKNRRKRDLKKIKESYLTLACLTQSRGRSHIYLFPSKVKLEQKTFTGYEMTICLTGNKVKRAENTPIDANWIWCVFYWCSS